MLKLPEINNGINPVARILPVIAVESIGDIAQELGDRATQFVKGREYTAQILSKVGESTYHVSVDVDGLKHAVLKMELGGVAAQPGQAMVLRYMQDGPVPTFLLTPPAVKATETTADISSAAHLIGNYLKAAEDEGVSSRYLATSVITHTPATPQLMAHDLRQAISASGLFYESHLADLLQSNQGLPAIRQEPQNQLNSPLATLVAQQLAILENQRLSWQGEVWPGQKMDWDVYVQQRDAADHRQLSAKADSEAKSVFSEMTLHLPRMGKVTAKLKLMDGRLRINITAEQLQTLDVLKSKRQSLAEAIVKNGQQLDLLAVQHHD